MNFLIVLVFTSYFLSVAFILLLLFYLHTQVPVVDGYSYPHLTKRMNVAGRHITSYLVDLLSRRGYSLTSYHLKMLKLLWWCSLQLSCIFLILFIVLFQKVCYEQICWFWDSKRNKREAMLYKVSCFVVLISWLQIAVICHRHDIKRCTAMTTNVNTS